LNQRPAPGFPDQLVWLFFKLDGRISRAAYLLAFLLQVMIQGFLLVRFMAAAPESTESGIWALSFWVAAILSIWCGFALGVKRVHDFGKPGLLALALFVPVLQLIGPIVLSILPGDPGPNRYGPRSDARATD
jgi:uncharacterized membrane protein YhaH (DUF805 family)